MARRSFMNDRYRPEAKVGSTRKSASKAKPVRKVGSVSTSAKPKAKPKQEKDWAGLPTSPEIKKWRRMWWGLLLGGLALIGIGYAVPELRADPRIQSGLAVVVLALSLTAVFIDVFVIRKLRKQLIEAGKPKGEAGKTKSEPIKPKGEAGKPQGGAS